MRHSATQLRGLLWEEWTEFLSWLFHTKIIQASQTAQRKTAIGELVGTGKVALWAHGLRKHHLKMFLLVDGCRPF